MGGTQVPIGRLKVLGTDTVGRIILGGGVGTLGLQGGGGGRVGCGMGGGRLS